MKRAVSISLGSSKRNKRVEIELLGEKVIIERIGTDGDMEKAAQLYRELDGKVDAFGVGGADLGLMVEGRWYPLHSVQRMVRYVRQTPITDGTGLKNTLEYRLAFFIDRHLGGYIRQHGGKKVLITLALDRWGMTRSFLDAGYQAVFGDLMFGLGLPIPIRSVRLLKALGRVFLPLVTRLPFEWLYPTGAKQEERVPKWHKYYQWATVIAGDCHYIKRHLPEHLPGKIIATNTTTEQDLELFRRVGIRYVVTSTPRLDGRSFGTNMMEAALIAVAGKGRPLTFDELDHLIDQLGLEPQLVDLQEGG